MTLGIRFRPRLADTLKDYSQNDFFADLIAGLTVGIVALPLAMAFGIASGVKPEAGIFTAVVAGFIISALGGSKVQIGGPTGAFVVIVYGIIARYGLDNLLICTVMAGVMLLIMGLTRMGTMIKFIPYPVTMGFTCGIAVLIFSTQIKDFLGLKLEKVPADFVDKMKALGENLGTWQWPTAALALASTLIIVFWPKPLAQGIANIASPLFGGIPATGAIARTATNIRSGARSPVAGITHALTLLIILLAAAPLAKFIPLATLSAVLMVVAYNMGEWHHFTRLAKWPKSDSAVFLATFALTVLIDLTVAVQVGMVLAAVLFIKRISETTQITAVDETTETEGAHHSLVGKEIPEGVMVYRVFGAFFFGAADKLETALKRARQEPDILILRMRKVLAMDATGLNALEDLYEKLKARRKHLILSGPHTQPLFVMDKSDFLDRIGREN